MSNEEDVIRIAVIGTDESGKSKFINVLSGTHPQTARHLASSSFPLELIPPFEIDGHTVRMMNAPGIGETQHSDVHVLYCLSESFGSENKLHGIIYLRNVSDLETEGISENALRRLRDLWGAEILHNVVVVTTMWSDLPLEQGKANEERFKTDPKFYKRALGLGARMMRFNGKLGTAQDILRTVYSGGDLLLVTPEELAALDAETGLALRTAFNELARRHVQEMESLRKEFSESVAEGKKAAERLARVEKALQASEDSRKRMERDTEDMRRKFQLENGTIKKELDDLKFRLGAVELRSQDNAMHMSPTNPHQNAPPRRQNAIQRTVEKWGL